MATPSTSAVTEGPGHPPSGSPLGGTRGRSLRRRPRPGEAIVRGGLLACGLASILTTVAIAWILVREAWAFFSNPVFSWQGFLLKTVWQPAIGEIGIWPLLSATLMTTLVALLVALPLGLAAAIYLSEYASPVERARIKPTLEILAGVPTVVYGFFALTFITPLLRELFGKDVVEIYNTGSAGIAMGILILPLVASMCEDALHAVPNRLREAAFGLGATRRETSLQVVVPAAFSGLVAAVIVAIGRAIGETMIVAIAAGAGPNFTLNPFKAAETVTGHIVRISGGDLSYGSIDYESIFALGLVLFLITLSLNLLSRRLVAKYREAYD